MSPADVVALAERHVTKGKGKMAVAFTCLTDARRLLATGHDLIAARVAVRALAYAVGVRHDDFLAARAAVIALRTPEGAVWLAAVREAGDSTKAAKPYRVARSFADATPGLYGWASHAASFATEDEALAAAHDAWTLKGTSTVWIDRYTGRRIGDGYPELVPVRRDVGGWKAARNVRIKERRDADTAKG